MASHLLLRPHLFTRPTSDLNRLFSTSSTFHASPLFMLSALSNSRETTHFNSITKLPRSEHSPPLALIRDGEIKPYPLPSPPPRAPTPLTLAFGSAEEKRRRRAVRAFDAKTVAVGRAVLAEQARVQNGLRRELRMRKAMSEQYREEINKLTDVMVKDVDQARTESRKAAGLVVIAVGVATAAVTWRLWPEGPKVDGLAKIRGTSEGGHVAKEASRLAPVAAVSEPTVAATGPSAAEAVAMGEPAAVVVPSEASVRPSAEETARSTASWWKGFFWKQS